MRSSPPAGGDGGAGRPERPSNAPGDHDGDEDATLVRDPGVPGYPTEQLRADHDELLRKKQRLAGLVVHDLRNPLAALQGHIEMMREDLLAHPVPAAVIENLDDCSALVVKVLSLVASILEVEELEEGVLRATPALIEAEALVHRALAPNRPAIRIRELHVEIDVAPGLAVWLDAELMYRVLENLLDNAVRYAPRGGRVVVRIHEAAAGPPGTVEIAVGNDGPPVPESEREAIFGRYYRIEARRASARAGKGLGLYFCKLAVEAHGGTHTVDQLADLGAVFVARIPPPPP